MNLLIENSGFYIRKKKKQNDMFQYIPSILIGGYDKLSCENIIEIFKSHEIIGKLKQHKNSWRVEISGFENINKTILRYRVNIDQPWFYCFNEFVKRRLEKLLSNGKARYDSEDEKIFNTFISVKKATKKTKTFEV